MDTTEHGREALLTCVECGYALRGLAREGDCPECGEPIARSAAALEGLTKREVVTLACRLLALWLAVRAIVAITGIAGWMLQVLLDPTSMPMVAMIVHLAGAGIVPLVAAAVLWWLSPRLARTMVRRDGRAFVGRLSARRVLAVGLVLLGAYLVVTGLEAMVAAGGVVGRQFLTLSHLEPTSALPLLAAGLARTLAGAVCIAIAAPRTVNARRIRDAIRRLRTAGT